MGKGVLILSTWFGAGLFPLAPGTFGTLGAIPLILLVDGLGLLSKALFLVVFLAVAVWSAGRCQDLVRRNDPSEVVIDEVAGFLLTMVYLPPIWPAIVLGFVLFRLFDILKPYPIRRIEMLRGGFGIVLDDLLAGLYACAGVWGILAAHRWFLGLF